MEEVQYGKDPGVHLQIFGQMLSENKWVMMLAHQKKFFGCLSMNISNSLASRTSVNMKMTTSTLMLLRIHQFQNKAISNSVLTTAFNLENGV